MLPSLQFTTAKVAGFTIAAVRFENALKFVVANVAVINFVVMRIESTYSFVISRFDFSQKETA